MTMRLVRCSRRAGGQLCLMDPVTFEQMSVEAALLGTQRPFLTEGMALKLQFHDGVPLSGARRDYKGSEGSGFEGVGL